MDQEAGYTSLIKVQGQQHGIIDRNARVRKPVLRVKTQRPSQFVPYDLIEEFFDAGIKEEPRSSNNEETADGRAHASINPALPPMKHNPALSAD